MAEGKKDFLVDALVSQSAKHAALPNDSARWAWVLMMGAGKFQHPPGTFRDVNHLAACLGKYSRYAKVLAETFCERGPDGSLKQPLEIHDWESWQPKNSTDRWRRWNERQKLKVISGGQS